MTYNINHSALKQLQDFWGQRWEAIFELEWVYLVFFEPRMKNNLQNASQVKRKQSPLYVCMNLWKGYLAGFFLYIVLIKNTV